MYFSRESPREVIFQPSIFGPCDESRSQLPPVIPDQTVQGVSKNHFIQTVIEDEEGPRAEVDTVLLIGRGTWITSIGNSCSVLFWIQDSPAWQDEY